MKARLKRVFAGDEATQGKVGQDGVVSAIESLQEQVGSLQKRVGTDESVPRSVRLNLDTLRLVAVEPIYAELRTFMSDHCLDFQATMERLAKQDIGFTRFGDGEFKVMLRVDGNHKFQTVVPELQNELIGIFANSHENLLVGLPHLFNNPFWSNIWANYYPQLKPLFGTSLSYACAHVTRPIYFRNWGERAVTAWKRVWDGMNAVIVTGRESKFDLIPELFDNLNGAEFVKGPNVNAYYELDALEEEAAARDADVVFTSLGPSGTVLASRLAARGIHALDLGHISASYKNVFTGEKRPEEL